MKHHSVDTRIIRSVIAALGLVTLLGLQACGGSGSSTLTFTVTVSTGTGGTTSETTITVAQGISTSFTITVDSGYSIENANGCSGSLAGTTYTTGAITANCTVTVTFLANPTGYYDNSGSATVHADSTPQIINDLQGLVTSTQFMLLSDSLELAYVGTISVSQNSFSGTVTIYETGVATQFDVPVSGMIIPESTITGTLTGAGLGNGSFTLRYAIDNGPVDNSMVYHDLDWVPMVSSVVNYISISDVDSSFGFVGIPSLLFDGCTTDSMPFAHIDSIAGTHLYTVTQTLVNCSNDVMMPATYTGLASLRGSNPDDRLIVILTNGSYGAYGEFQRD